VIDLGIAKSEDLRSGAEGAKIVVSDADISRRALLAFLKSTKAALEAPRPTEIEHIGKRYVALIATTGIAAIYRVRNDLQLKRMRRIPQPVAYIAELERRGGCLTQQEI
jgi:hypothetical protein